MPKTIFYHISGTFPAQSGWMTVPDNNASPAKAAAVKGEPLVQSVRTYLADEPHKIIVRVLSQPEPEPQLSDVHIASDSGYVEALKQRDVIKRNDLNNNSKNKPSTRKTTEENQNSESNGRVDVNAMPSAAERMQRQPLLGPNKLPSHTITIEDSDPDHEDALHQSGQTFPNGDLQLESSGRESDRYPREILKTVLSFFFTLLCVCINMCALAIVHEWVPDRKEFKPLPDVFLDNVPAMDWALGVSELIIMVTTSTASVVIAMHKHRFIVLRRVFFLLGLLYLYRSLTMFVTVVPVSSTTYHCSPKLNGTITPGIVFERMFHLLSGFGLSINGKHTYCGDYIFSGHTTVLVLGYLVISEYIPRKLRILHWLFFFSSSVGVIFLLLAHGHYTVDVVIAYYITTRLFWNYHSMTKQSTRLGNAGMITREWWYPIFLYFERNVLGPVPRQYDWPFPWPKFLVKFFNRLS